MLLEGNARFVSGEPQRPRQSMEHRGALVEGQRPFATIFGCSDSRVAAEVVFDQGLGDLFVVRTAGHVVGPTELGSLEFGAHVLGIPLIVVLGHDSCGAVSSTMRVVEKTTDMPGGFVRDLIERIIPSVLLAKQQNMLSTDQVEAEHVRQTVSLLQQRSPILAERVEAGMLKVVGLTYSLQEGRAKDVTANGTKDSGQQA